MPKPFQYVGKVEQVAANNSTFMSQLWDGTDAVRTFLMNQPEPNVRADLANRGFNIPGDVQIIFVDIQNGAIRKMPAQIPTRDEFYVLVLPPFPLRDSNPEYVAAQSWSEASFHAGNDGYGM